MLGVARPLSAFLSEGESRAARNKALGANRGHEARICTKKRTSTAIMANTEKLTKEERKKAKRASRKKTKAEKPKKPRDYARGSKKRKVKKLARGQSKR
jgi:hypothetical protein